MSRPPLPALVLGYAGLLPPLGSIALEFTARRTGDPGSSAFLVAMPGLFYIALILSFLGGIWWGVAAVRVDGRALWSWLLMAVAPSLGAAAAFLTGWIATPPIGWGVALAAGLLLSLLGDLRLVRAELVPGWWMALRVPLSCGLAAEAVAIALLA